MKAKKTTIATGIAALASAILLALSPNVASAHCDTLDGPVVAAARTALEIGDVAPVLKWVKPDRESEIREAFHRTLSVRGLGPEAETLADNYFFETLVRLHRAGEGAPYTGLKPAGEVDPAIAAADKALETGDIDALIETVQHEMEIGITEKFRRVAAASRHKDESVEAGREYVEAYVIYTHYIEGIHRAMQLGGGHSGEGPEGEKPNAHGH